MSRLSKTAKRALFVLVTFGGVLVLAHLAVGLMARMPVPSVRPFVAIGRSHTSTHEGVREVYLEGSPEEIGAEHSTLLRQRMVENEQIMWHGFADLVPFGPARLFFFDVGRVRYRSVWKGIPERYLREIASQAASFTPDPYESKLPTFERMVMLHSLYDVALGFEGAPMIGCSAFVLGPKATRSGHTLLGRAFDIELADVFDRDKAVYFVKGDDVLPFASVAWPGLVGVLTAMNSEGVTLAVNGGRAGEPSTEGVPVVFSLRNALERAHTAKEAVEILSADAVMVSHIVIVTDARGDTAIVERAPGRPAHVRRDFADSARVGVTNHFEGAFANDPKNVRVKEKTTTLARRARLDELLHDVKDHSADEGSVLSMLRDHGCANGEACPPGDRRAIDAFIATHGVIADATAHVLWVSAGPHLSGKFVRFSLDRVFAGQGEDAPTTLAEDGALHDGRYTEGRVRAGGPLFRTKTPPP